MFQSKTMQGMFGTPAQSAADRILKAIAQGKEKFIRTQLNRGLKPNAFDTSWQHSMLDYAIIHGQIGIAVLLLLHGANPNTTIMVRSADGRLQQKGSAESIFENEHFNKSLAKLLVSYGADYSARDTPAYHNQNFRGIWSLREDYATAYQKEQLGGQLFKAKDWSKAKEAYGEAIALLEQFERDETTKLIFQQQHDVIDKDKTHPMIVTCYQQRIEHCQKQMAKCDKQMAKAKRQAPEKPAQAGSAWSDLTPPGGTDGEATPPRKGPQAFKGKNLLGSLTLMTPRRAPQTAKGSSRKSHGSLGETLM